MKFSLIAFALLLVITSCDMKKDKTTEGHEEGNKELSVLFENYYEERLQLFPLEATSIGDPRYNDRLTIGFTDSFRTKLNDFYTHYLAEINKHKRDELSEKDQLSYDVFIYELQTNKEGLGFP